MGDGPGLSRWAPCCHKRPYKTEGDVRVRNHVGQSQRLEGCVLRMEEALSQRIRCLQDLETQGWLPWACRGTRPSQHLDARLHPPEPSENRSGLV